jgi:tripartite-type tricarboxylate transporter receptor subunit TctC
VTARTLVRLGALHALAITVPQRPPAYPDVPTMAEAGVPDVEVALWMGLFVSVGTPPAIVKRLNEGVARRAAARRA